MACAAGQSVSESALRETFGAFRHGVLAKRLLLAIVVFSSAVTFVLTLLDLLVDYRNSVDDLQRRLDAVENSYAFSLGEGLWFMDQRQLALQVEGIARLPDVRMVEVREDVAPGRTPMVVAVGERQTGAAIVRDIALSCVYDGTVRRIGTLHIEANLTGIYQRLISRAVVILGNSAVKTFLVATFILFIVHHLVTRHLVEIATRVSCITSVSAAPLLRLHRRARQGDELDSVVEAINAMGSNLAKQQGALEATNETLVRNVAALADAKESLRKSYDALDRSNRELERFAFIASHDLQEPARTLVSYSQLIERRYGNAIGDDDGRQFLGYIVDAALRMQKMVQGLLAYSEIGRLNRPFLPMSMAIVVRTALDSMRGELAGSDVQVEVDLPDSPTVMGDESQLVTVVRNLLSNAIAFRRQGVVPIVRIAAVRAGDSWEFSVADNGVGVEQPYWDDIFLIFKSFGPNGGRSGIGTGLALCKRIVEFHGGTIWVVSQPGMGATFSFRLPCSAATPGMLSAAAPGLTHESAAKA
jgi:signal transduction histidine kinase